MISLKKAEEICSRFKEKKILIFGDFILDKYIFGEVDRISPEAPVPIIKIGREEYRPGGSGNVAANLNKLGAKTVLMGIYGGDNYAAEAQQAGGLMIIKSESNRTVVKTRVVSGRQHIIRIDRDKKMVVDPHVEDQIIRRFELNKADGIIVSDYAKGTVTSNIIEYLKLKAKSENIPLIVDPKPVNMDLYKKVDGLTPNLKEAEEIAEKRITNDSDAGEAIKTIRRKYNCKYVVITKGNRGMSAGEKGKKLFHVPAFSHEVFDVTGAGDTVTSLIMLSLVSGGSLKHAVDLANVAASLVIEKVGAAQTTPTEIMRRLKYLLKH